MWVYTGGVVILKAGKYTICDASDDGSKVWIEGKLEIDNDGLHSRKEVCTVMNLKAKTYYFKVAGFSADHDCVQVTPRAYLFSPLFPPVDWTLACPGTLSRI